MNTRRVLAASFLLSAMFLSAMASAQSHIRIAPGTFTPVASEASGGSELTLPGGLKAPQGMFDEFWNDPEIVKQLELTPEQKTQLQQAAMAQKLALVDSGAGALKSFVLLSAIVDAEPFDEAAYQKASDELAATTAKTVQSLAEMVATRRRILTPDQFAQLRAMQKAKREAAKRKADAAESCSPARRGRGGREIPSSLGRPMD
jgi:Spy/CpxP family protein refolding chaperone